jgi:GntR family transcriptional regulator of arabinose operon
MKRSLPQRIALAIVAEYLETGFLEAGDRLPTVRELERSFQVSRNTILQALSFLEQQGYVYRKHGSGVFVAHQSPPAQGSVPLIGFVGPNVYADLMLRVYEGVEQVARLHGMHVVVGSTSNDYQIERWQVSKMVQAGCQAVVLFPCTRTKSQLRQDYLKSEFLDTPIVLVDTAYPEQERPQVVFDNYRAGYEMTQLLLHEGHRHIAFMDFARHGDDWVHYSTRERYRGYVDALKQAGITPQEQYHWIIWDKHFAVDNVQPDIRNLLELAKHQTPRPSAVIAIEDAMAVQTIVLAQEMGFAVPEQLRVVGFDDLLVAHMFRPEFPTTAPDFRRAGELAAELAIRLIRGEKLPPLVYILPVPIRRRRVSAKGSALAGTTLDPQPEETPVFTGEYPASGG